MKILKIICFTSLEEIDVRWNMVTLANIRIGFAFGMSTFCCLFSFYIVGYALIATANIVSSGIWS